MTLAEILYEAGELGNTSQRVSLDWKRFVNRAVRKIVQRRNWSACHDQRSVFIQQGVTSAPLDKNFKCLSSERSPVSYQDPTVPYPLPVPCEVISRAMANRMGFNPWTTPFPTAPVCFSLRYVYIERNGPGGAWTLNLPIQAIANPATTFTISGFYFPNDLINADDSNAITNHPELCDAVINLTKYLAYSAEDNAPQQEQIMRQRYEESYNHAAYGDAYQSLQGRALRM